MSICNTCQFWFPRPPLPKYRDSEQDTQRLLGRIDRYLQRKRELTKTLEKRDSANIHKFIAYFRLYLEQF